MLAMENALIAVGVDLGDSAWHSYVEAAQMDVRWSRTNTMSAQLVPLMDLARILRFGSRHPPPLTPEQAPTSAIAASDYHDLGVPAIRPVVPQGQVVASGTEGQLLGCLNAGPGELCSICVEEGPMIGGGQPVVVTECGHMFHSACLSRHARTQRGAAVTCPLCRSELRFSGQHAAAVPCVNERPRPSLLSCLPGPSGSQGRPGVSAAVTRQPRPA